MVEEQVKSENEEQACRPKIAIVVNEPTPYRLHLLRRFVREIPEVHIQTIFTSQPGNLSVPWQMDLTDELCTISLPSQMSGTKSKRDAWQLGGEILDHIEREGIRFVLLHGYSGITRLRIILGCVNRKADVFVRGDSNCFDERGKPLWKRIFKEYYLRALLRRAKGVMAMGTAGRAYFAGFVTKTKPIILVPCEPDYASLSGVTADDRQRFLAHFGLDPHRKRMLYCGRMIRIKRVDQLIRAFERIAEANPEWDLVLAGTGADTELLKASVQDSLRGRIHWLGFLQFEQVRQCYAACDVLVHPSIYEPWGLVINEAVAAGMAVVATDVTGAAIDLVRHGTNGLLFAPDDERALAEAMLQVTEPGVLEAMRGNAPLVLEQWQRAADPVVGLRKALRLSGVLPC